MINTSAKYKTALSNDWRKWRELITITLADSTVLNLTEADIWGGGVTIRDAISDDEGFDVIGSAVIGEATLVINNIDGTYDGYDFQWAEVSIRLGITFDDGTIETFKRGTYIVTEQPDYANASLIELSLMDNMYKLDRDYSTALTYPTTTGAIVNEICTNCSVTNNTPTFPNYNIAVTVKPDITDYTYREVLAYMCQIAGCYARFNVDGELELKAIDTTNLAKAVANTSGAYHKFTQIFNNQASFDDVVITGVKVLIYEDTGTDLVERTYTSGTTDYCITLEHNPFVKASEGQTFANRIGALVNGIKFRKIDVSHGSDPSIEAGDIAQVIDGRGNKYGFVITSTEFNSNDNQHTLCSALSPERNSAQRYTATTRNYVELRKQQIKDKSATDLLIQNLNTAIGSMGGMYYDEEPAPGGGTYYILHNKPDIADSPVQLRITDEAVAITNNALDPTPTWYGLTVDGNFIANILAAYTSVIVGLAGGSHMQIDTDYSTFYGPVGDVVGRIENGSGTTTSGEHTLMTASTAKGNLVVNNTTTITVVGLPSNDADFPIKLRVEKTDDTYTDVTGSLPSTQSGYITLTNTNITVKVEFNRNDLTVKTTITAKSGSNQKWMQCEIGTVPVPISTPKFWFGRKLNVTGTCSFATGVNNSVLSNTSFVAGTDNTVEAEHSAAFGRGLTAYRSPQYSQFVIGDYNIPDTGNDYIFIIGNGTSGSQSNALTVDESGNVVASGDVTANGQSISGKVSKVGDTMSGLLRVNRNSASISQSMDIRSAFMNEDGTTPGSFAESDFLGFTDTDGTVMSRYGAFHDTSGNVGARIVGWRTVNGNREYTGLNIGVQPDGTSYVGFAGSNPATAWRNALGIQAITSDTYTINGVTFTFQKSGRVVVVTSSGTPTNTVTTDAYAGSTTVAAAFEPYEALIANVNATPGVGMQVNLSTSRTFRYGYSSANISSSNIRVNFTYIASGF